MTTPHPASDHPAGHADPDHADAPPSPRSPLADWPPTDWIPEAVVFDCDGLLLDTEAAWIGLQENYLARHHATLTPDVRHAITGASAEAVVGALAEAVGKPPAVVSTELMDFDDEAFRHVRMMPGALETVRVIAERRPVAVASNSPRSLLDHKLHGMGIAEVIDASVAVEDVTSPKPAPDMYAHAAELLGADPGRTLAFEDSETGARSARTAGLVLIAVPSIPGQAPGADRTLSALTDPDLHTWIDTWSPRR
ncbi:MAG: HAD family phosphatase [Brachybacterium sp.]|nr:HAD family phosphatase [Brachybacterium sp.]